MLIALVWVGCKKNDKNKVVELREDTRYTFTVTVKGFWTETTHPQDFPNNANFGKIVGISHRNEDLLFKKGKKATSWIQSYLDSQSTTAFTSYFQEYKEGDKVDAIFTKEGFAATGETDFEFVTKGKHHRVSLLMQLTPSPDWFAAIKNVNLNALAVGGYTTYIVNTWDAGLYSGNNYTEKGNTTSNNIIPKIDAPLNYPNGGVNKFAIVTIKFKKSEKISK